MQLITAELQAMLDMHDKQKKAMADLHQGRTRDRRNVAVPIAHEDRRKGPRRWIEVRAKNDAKAVDG